ncbi:MAG: TIGR02996 domain-containing protein, partial [Deltaproteobacteria bacterium]|nr:TIGR02996 domain-containing protein [Deltaproteobacteria bacterium]
MLAAIYDDPFDDQLRSVYADALIEQGDPHGELIQLQLQAAPSSEARRRIGQLLAKHERTWLGPIAPVVAKGGVEFRRGFVAVCKAKFKNEQDVRAYGSHPAWATVEELTHAVGAWSSGAQYRWSCWIDPAMKSLTSVRLHDVNAAELLDTPVPWNLRRLVFGTSDVDTLARLAVTDTLPKLESLWIDRPARGWIATARCVR